MTPAALRRFAAALLLGFASGLPLALSGTALQAWLTVAGHDVSTIGFLTLIGLPYTFKFLWAPLMDRVEPPFLGRRRGWILVCQIGLVGALLALSTISPQNVAAIGGVAALVAFLSASQDIVVDAWKTDALTDGERGLGASLGVLGYRLAMVLSGGVVLIWADPVQGGMTWPEVYQRLAALLAIVGALAVALVPGLPARERPIEDEAPLWREFAGFGAVMLAAAVGWSVARWPGSWVGAAAVAPFVIPEKVAHGFSDLIALVLGMAVALPLGKLFAQTFGYETLTRSLAGFFAQPRAKALLGAVVLYKMGDAFAMSLNTTFLLTGAGFSTAEVGVVNKVFGIWLTVVGSLIGGLLLPVLGLGRALIVFGLLQAAAVVGFFLLAVYGRGAWGSLQLAPFDLGFVWLKEAVTVDYGMLAAVAAEHLTSGLGTAAFAAFLMALSKSRFSATQYALVSALAAVGRVWVGPFAGVTAEVFGWPTFFVVAIFVGLPGVGMVFWLRREVDVLGVTARTGS